MVQACGALKNSISKCRFPWERPLPVSRRTELASEWLCTSQLHLQTLYLEGKKSWPRAAISPDALRTVAGPSPKLHLWKAELAATILNAQESGMPGRWRAQGSRANSSRPLRLSTGTSRMPHVCVHSAFGCWGRTVQHIEMNTESGSTSLPLLIFYLMGVWRGKSLWTGQEMKWRCWCCVWLDSCCPVERQSEAQMNMWF